MVSEPIEHSARRDREGARRPRRRKNSLQGHPFALERVKHHLVVKISVAFVVEWEVRVVRRNQPYHNLTTPVTIAFYLGSVCVASSTSAGILQFSPAPPRHRRCLGVAILQIRGQFDGFSTNFSLKCATDYAQNTGIVNQHPLARAYLAAAPTSCLSLKNGHFCGI